MKIAIVIWKMAFSGAENVANALIEQFSEKGHEVQIILTASDVPENVKYTTYSIVVSGKNGIRQIKRSLALRKIVMREKYDVVVGFGHIDVIHILRALPLMGVKTIGCARMDPVKYPTSIFLRWERSLMYRGLSGMVVQTNTQKQFFDKIVKKNCFVIPNPVRNIPIEPLSIEDRKKRIVTVARLDNAQKNHLFMFDCFAEFSKNRAGYILEIYGDGPDKAMYEEYIEKLGLSDLIIMRGHVANPQEMIKDATMFLMTSVHEGMPNALIEAMSLGIPSITTDCGGGGAKDLICDGENGFIVPQGDKELFVRRMIQLSDNVELRRKISKHSYEIREKLEISKIADRWLEAFEKISCGD